MNIRTMIIKLVIRKIIEDGLSWVNETTIFFLCVCCVFIKSQVFTEFLDILVKKKRKNFKKIKK